MCVLPSLLLCLLLSWCCFIWLYTQLLWDFKLDIRETELPYFSTQERSLVFIHLILLIIWHISSFGQSLMPINAQMGILFRKNHCKPYIINALSSIALSLCSVSHVMWTWGVHSSLCFLFLMWFSRPFSLNYTVLPSTNMAESWTWHGSIWSGLNI